MGGLRVFTPQLSTLSSVDPCPCPPRGYQLRGGQAQSRPLSAQEVRLGGTNSGCTLDTEHGQRQLEPSPDDLEGRVAVRGISRWVGTASSRARGVAVMLR